MRPTPRPGDSIKAQQPVSEAARQSRRTGQGYGRADGQPARVAVSGQPRSLRGATADDSVCQCYRRRTPNSQPTNQPTNQPVEQSPSPVLPFGNPACTTLTACAPPAPSAMDGAGCCTATPSALKPLQPSSCRGSVPPGHHRGPTAGATPLGPTSHHDTVLRAGGQLWHLPFRIAWGYGGPPSAEDRAGPLAVARRSRTTLHVIGENRRRRCRHPLACMTSARHLLLS